MILLVPACNSTAMQYMLENLVPVHACIYYVTTPLVTDVNECLDGNGGCEQVCRNSPGSHHCECTTGYRLVDDFNCAGEDINPYNGCL